MRARRFASAVFVASALIHPLSAQAPDAGKTKSTGFTGGVALTCGNLTGGDFDGTKAGASFDLNAGITRGAGNWDSATTVRITATRTRPVISW